ncbi:unnamed protein product [Polarella glacialis]|uniref:SREBP regulating gene protein n=1 Tax=Polarella glacialis TaxID=89957 RepID=A0A813IWM8_POLGL|nr:unnamed protein product [Polarella glacialis]
MAWCTVLVLACVALPQVVLVEARVGAKGIFSHYTSVLEEKECTCNCCIRELRRPSEVTEQAKNKCALAPPNDSRIAAHGCTETCTVVNDPVFIQASTIEMNRFCFHHCRPTVGGMQTPFKAAAANQNRAALVTGGSLLDAECVSIRPEQLSQAISADGNGKDAQLQA